MKNQTRKLVKAALLASICCVATMIIKIPSQMGYVNLGDCIVLLSSALLSPVYAFLAAGLGSALADVLSGYTFYAPATFIIKGLMALISFAVFRLLEKKLPKPFSRIIGGLFAELFMILGYFLFEGALYGFATAALNIPANALQGATGIALGVILIRVFGKNNISRNDN